MLLLGTGLPAQASDVPPLRVSTLLGEARRPVTLFESDELDPPELGMSRSLGEASQQMQQMAQTIEQLKADRSIKAAEAETKQFAAETDRLQAVAPAMGPAEIQMLVVNTMREIMGQPLQ